METTILPLVGDNVITLLHDGREAAVVDPAAAAPVRQALASTPLILRHILLTHHHGDHTAGCHELVQATGCEIIGPDDRRLSAVDHPVADGQRIRIVGTELHVLHVPGHTRSHLAFYGPEAEAVWTGDTVFVAGCGRLMEGSPEEMWTSIRRIRALPDNTRLYCGHDYTLENLEFAAHLLPNDRSIADKLDRVRALVNAKRPTIPSRIAEERATNPFMRCDQPGMAEAAGTRSDDPAEIFAVLRRLKDRW